MKFSGEELRLIFNRAGSEIRKVEDILDQNLPLAR
jgi:hypothetical protein